MTAAAGQLLWRQLCFVWEPHLCRGVWCEALGKPFGVGSWAAPMATGGGCPSLGPTVTTVGPVAINNDLM